MNSVDQISNNTSRQETGNAPDINLSSDFFPSGRVFRIYVGVEGVVKAVDETGNEISRHFIVGYHPIRLKKVLSSANGTTATDLAACF